MREDFCYRLYQYLIRSTFIRCNQYPLFNSSGVVSYVNCSSDYVRLDVCTLECFQMKTHSVKKCSSSNKVLAHTKKCHLAPILYEKNFDKGLRKAKNCKINL